MPNIIVTIVASPILLNSITPKVIFIPLKPTIKITDVRIKFLDFIKADNFSEKTNVIEKIPAKQTTYTNTGARQRAYNNSISS